MSSASPANPPDRVLALAKRWQALDAWAAPAGGLARVDAASDKAAERFDAAVRRMVATVSTAEGSSLESAFTAAVGELAPFERELEQAEARAARAGRGASAPPQGSPGLGGILGRVAVIGAGAAAVVSGVLLFARKPRSR